MSWLSQLLDPLLDRLATKLAQRVRIEIDAALEQTENRIQAILKDAEGRLLASAGQGMASVTKLGPVLPLQQGELTSDGAVVAAEEIRAMLRRNTARRADPSPEIPDR